MFILPNAVPQMHYHVYCIATSFMNKLSVANWSLPKNVFRVIKDVHSQSSRAYAIVFVLYLKLHGFGVNHNYIADLFIKQMILYS